MKFLLTLVPLFVAVAVAIPVAFPQGPFVCSAYYPLLIVSRDLLTDPTTTADGKIDKVNEEIPVMSLPGKANGDTDFFDAAAVASADAAVV